MSDKNRRKRIEKPAPQEFDWASVEQKIESPEYRKFRNDVISQMGGIKPSLKEESDGVVVAITEDEIILDIGLKYSVTVEVFREKSNIEFINNLKIGDIVPVRLVNSHAGVIGTFEGVSREIIKREIMEVLKRVEKEEEGIEPFTARITEHVGGGFYAEVRGIKTYLPGSLVSLEKIYNYHAFINKELPVYPVAWQKDRGMFVVSHKAVLLAQGAEKKEATPEKSN